MSSLLEIGDLSITLPWVDGERRVVSGLSLEIGVGESVGLVGESGSGKSMTARSVIRLLPRGALTTGRVVLDGRSILDMDSAALRQLRRNDVAMIFQDPHAHMNPVRTVGDFVTEGLRLNRGISREEALERVGSILDEVAIPSPERVLAQYPHELSGGLLQRAMIAAAIASGPRLLLADEPTTALDVTTQADVMAILRRSQQEHGQAVLFITHDLDLALAACDRTYVMYTGAMMEEGRSETMHRHPLHPYTAALFSSRPRVESTHGLAPIPGRAVPAWDAPSGCPFRPRCEFAESICAEVRPRLRQLGAGAVACHRAEAIHELLAERAGELDRAL